MRNIIKNNILMLFALLTMLAASSCERRELVGMIEDGVTVNFTIDWSKYNATKPTKITLIIYPQKGKLITLTRTDVDGFSTTLPAGHYEALVINNEPIDFECYDFTYNPFTATLIDGIEPQALGVDRITFDVPEPTLSVDENGDLVQHGSIVDAETLYPRNLLWTGDVIVKMAGYDHVESLNGTLSGMMNTYGSDRNATKLIMLDDWTGNSEESLFKTKFACLGLPDSHTEQPTDNILTLKFGVKNRDDIETEYEVGNKLNINEEEQTYTITVSKTIRNTEGGFDIDVLPWGDEQ